MIITKIIMHNMMIMGMNMNIMKNIQNVDNVDGDDQEGKL